MKRTLVAVLIACACAFVPGVQAAPEAAATVAAAPADAAQRAFPAQGTVQEPASAAARSASTGGAHPAILVADAGFNGLPSRRSDAGSQQAQSPSDAGLQPSDPGAWGLYLAGLLVLVAIARRRMTRD